MAVARSTNGCGTMLYGEIKTTDHKYIATKWLTGFGLPIFPLGSYEIDHLGRTHPSRKSLKKGQTLRTFLVGLILVSAVSFFLSTIVKIPMSFNKLFTGAGFQEFMQKISQEFKAENFLLFILGLYGFCLVMAGLFAFINRIFHGEW